MSRIVYKSDYFEYLMPKKFNERLQQMLDMYTEDGWLLHSYHVEGTLCTLVFYREEQD